MLEVDRNRQQDAAVICIMHVYMNEDMAAGAYPGTYGNLTLSSICL